MPLWGGRAPNFWPKSVGSQLSPLGRGELGPHLTPCGGGRRLPTCQVSSWSIQPSDRYHRVNCFTNSRPKTVRSMQLDHCLSILSVCDAGVLWPDGWMHQDETWHGGRPRPWPHCVRCGPIFPKRGTAPVFGPCLLWPNGCMDQDTLVYRWASDLATLCSMRTQTSPKRAQPSNFWTMSGVAKRLPISPSTC